MVETSFNETSQHKDLSNETSPNKTLEDYPIEINHSLSPITRETDHNTIHGNDTHNDIELFNQLKAKYVNNPSISY